MNKLWQKVAFFIATAVAIIYTYSLFQRFTRYFAGGTATLHTRGVAMVITATIFLLTIIVGEKKWSFRMSVILVHFLFFALCTQGVDLLLKAVVGEENLHTWNSVFSVLIIPMLLTFITVAAGYLNMMDIRRKEYTVYTEKQLRSEGYRILFISDLHFGNALKRKHLDEIIPLLSKEKADLVLIGGDVIDEHTKRRQVVRVFGELGKIDSEYGNYFVFGNHDRGEYDKTAHLIDEDRLKSIIEKSGIVNLESDRVYINDDLVIIGRDDRYYEKQSVQQLMHQVPQDRFILVMDHQPYEFREKSEAGVDLELSGHTHGGQFWPLGRMIERMQDQNYGIRKWGNMTAIVTSGMSGGNMAVRTSYHSEYVVIDILPEKKGKRNEEKDNTGIGITQEKRTSHADGCSARDKAI